MVGVPGNRGGVDDLAIAEQKAGIDGLVPEAEVERADTGLAEGRVELALGQKAEHRGRGLVVARPAERDRLAVGLQEQVGGSGVVGCLQDDLAELPEGRIEVPGGRPRGRGGPGAEHTEHDGNAARDPRSRLHISSLTPGTRQGPESFGELRGYALERWRRKAARRASHSPPTVAIQVIASDIGAGVIR